MNILLATSEAVPFSKTGGLADVCGALPIELERMGHQVVVIIPAVRQALASGLPMEETGLELAIEIGSKTVRGRLLKSTLPGSSVPVYLVRQDQYYDRPGLYQEGKDDYIDNCERFVFFCRAVMEAIRLLSLRVDVLHGNDWPCGLLPAYLKIEYRGLPGYETIATLFTIRNMAFQGTFWHWDMLLTGLDWKYFNWRQMEFYGQLNLLKTGLVFSDAINTVSPRYAEEIQGPDLGCGLEGELQHRHDVLSGIINGVDYGVWNPATDPKIAQNYDVQTVAAGKAKCKWALQGELGLPQLPKTPLIGLIGRLTEQKGIDLVTSVMQDWLHRADVQFVILGTGDQKYHDQLTRLADRFPQKAALRLAFSDDLAHRIEASGSISDAEPVWTPSRRLNQLYSLKYGTVPLVRETGGLANTVTDTNRETLAAGTATGFTFRDSSMLALSETLRRACDTYQQPQVWSQIVATGMRQDWSWSRSAKEYVNLYNRIVARQQQPIATSL